MREVALAADVRVCLKDDVQKYDVKERPFHWRTILQETVLLRHREEKIYDFPVIAAVKRK